MNQRISISLVVRYPNQCNFRILDVYRYENMLYVISRFSEFFIAEDFSGVLTDCAEINACADVEVESILPVQHFVIGINKYYFSINGEHRPHIPYRNIESTNFFSHNGSFTQKSSHLFHREDLIQEDEADVWRKIMASICSRYVFDHIFQGNYSEATDRANAVDEFLRCDDNRKRIAELWINPAARKDNIDQYIFRGLDKARGVLLRNCEKHNITNEVMYLTLEKLGLGRKAAVYDSKYRNYAITAATFFGGIAISALTYQVYSAFKPR